MAAVHSEALSHPPSLLPASHLLSRWLAGLLLLLCRCTVLLLLESEGSLVAGGGGGGQRKKGEVHVHVDRGCTLTLRIGQHVPVMAVT